MALANKYSTTYCDVFGNTCIVYILQEGYVGGVTELEAQTTPFTITYESKSDFKFDPIRSSRCTVRFVIGTGNELDEFWTQNEREYKVEHYIAGVLDWVGWVLPNGYTKELTGKAYYAEIEASDGLNTLDAKPFLNEGTGLPYGIDDLSPFHNDYDFSLNYLLCEILKKTDLDLPYHVCVDVYEATMTRDVDSRNGDPLTQAYVNVRTYIGDTDRDDIPYWRDAGEVFNTLEVLENLCYLFGAKIYQQQGVWKFKRVNADLDYGLGSQIRYFYRYDTNGNYIPVRLANGSLKQIPCLSADWNTALIEDDHQLTMDDVYKAFRVNYKFTYARFGDTNINLFENGDFSESWANTSPTASPPKWFRQRKGDKWYPRLKQVTIPLLDRANTDGIANAIEFGTTDGTLYGNNDSNPAVWASLQYGTQLGLNQGDELNLRFYAKFQPNVLGINGQACMIQMFIISTDGTQKYCASTKFENNGSALQKFAWYEVGLNEDLFFPCWRAQSDEYLGIGSGDNNYQWLTFNLAGDGLPVSGTLTFRIHGLGCVSGRESDNFPAFNVKVLDTTTGAISTTGRFLVQRLWVDEGGDAERLQVTGFYLGIIASEEDREKQSSYIQYNSDTSYTLQKKPITVLNGDTVNKFAISGIDVPSQAGERNFWEDIEGSYGRSTLGLVLAKSVMEIYSTPHKNLEGIVKVADAQFGDVYSFDAIGGERFIMQRGTFDRKRGYIRNATFMEIASSATLPQEGIEDGANTDPIWADIGDGFNGVIRCELDGSNQNTGFVEVQQSDININSETYGDLRWFVTSGIPNTAICPTSAFPNFLTGNCQADFYSGNSIGRNNGPIDPAPADGFYEFIYFNPGGFHFCFLHLLSFGTVQEVRCNIQNQIVSDWTYVADYAYLGTTYKVLVLNYPLAYVKTQVAFKF